MTQAKAEEREGNKGRGEEEVMDYDLESWLQIPKDKNWVQALDTKAYINAFWEQNTRPDGRLFFQARPTKVISSFLKHSSGSGLVQQGDTKILASTRIEIGQPAPEFPNHGDVLVVVTDNSNKDNNTKAGATTTHNDRLRSFLQRMLDDLLPSQLGLLSGKAAIRLIVSVMVLQDSGNVIDASLLACMAAWKDTLLPTMDELQESNGKLWWKDSPMSSLNKDDNNNSDNNNNNSMSLDRDYRVSLTMGIIIQQGGADRKEEEREVRFLVDPSDDEAKFTDGELTIVVTMPSRTLQVEYTGSIGLDAQDLALAVKLANGRADELASLL